MRQAVGNNQKATHNSMIIPKKLIFNFYTKETLSDSLNYIFLNRRLKSMSMDFAFILGVSVPFFLMTMIPIFILAGSGSSFDNIWPMVIGIVPFSIFTAFLLNKDFFNAKSVAKRKLGYQVIDKKTSEPADELKCVIRNSTLIIWPLEVIVTLISPRKRLGDIIAGTMLTDSEIEDPELILDEINMHNEFKNGKKILWISIVIGLIFSVIAGLPTVIRLI